MFSTRLTRVTQRATTSAAAIPSPTSTAAHRTTQCLAAKPGHQRRPSSSKASCPPDSDKPAPAAKAAAASADLKPSQAPASASAPPLRKTKRTTRLNRIHASLGERMSRSREQVDHFAGLPSVPGIGHLHEKDVTLSSFFSLHRPLSVTTTIPPPTTSEAFNNLFATQPQRDPWENGNSAERRPEDVIYTLHNTIESLDHGANSAQDDGVRWEVLQESQSNNHDAIKHLDSAPMMKSLDELVAQFKPFSAPPPPQPFPDEQKAGAGEKKRAAAKQTRSSAQRPQQKSYQTTITFTDITAADGTRMVRPHVSPLVRIADPLAEDALEIHATQGPGGSPPQQQQRIRQPFLERMRRRQQLYLQAQHTKILERMGEQRAVRRAPSEKRIKMLLISVKRQRKLKMKKHKYKKLMKRTRNLRRRLDRT
ncbi:hypothetical protein LTR36_001651 [Oleoguttula mirabilis]|uniref:Small ribosomal subunit protein mS38 n=1 Tax=Oleoguttula mirabilis TaxID=1507867 RepID=A0AAV9JNH6_9PEZI|nr:hypothetical protein LTR36_001651 [Oleoguttula mirabilis]